MRGHIIDESEGGASNFTDLNDTPSSYTGQAGNYTKVNATEDGLEYGVPAGGGDVTAAANITDNALVRGDGGVKGIQGSGITVNDTDDIDMNAGDITNVGNVDGRDVSTDGAKLDGIEAGADVTDATNVDAAGAIMDSDISEAEGFMRKTGAGAYEAIKSNLSATTAPTANDDSASGYAIGSLWIDITNDKIYQCVDTTATAAIWKHLSEVDTNVVTSVFSRTGDVTAQADDYTWAQIDKATSDIADITTKSHTSLSDIGTNTHAQIDTHIGNTSNPHSVTAAQLNALQNIVEDPAPQLGEDLDLNDKAIYITCYNGTGAALALGDIMYISGDQSGNPSLTAADASAEATAKETLVMVMETINDAATGKCCLWGVVNGLSTLTVGSYYLSETAKEYTATAPTTSGAIQRRIGAAISTTQMFFKPGDTYIEIA